MDMKTSEYLTAARERVAEGWVQGIFEDYRGYVCTTGALRRAEENHNIQPGTYAEGRAVLVNKILEEYPVGMWTLLASEGSLISIPVWNDHKGRTQQEVLNMFDKSILALQEEGH
jgi:hypothetical protein